MPLTTRAPGQSPIDSSAINQFVSALTGVLTDQPFTLANTLTVTNTITGSSQATITNLLTASSNLTVSNFATISALITGSSAITAVGNITASSGFLRSRNGSSTPGAAAIQVFGMGSSGPGFYWGSSVPTIAGVQGSLMINTGGSSTTTFYVATANNGTASSSQWTPVTLG